MARESGTDEIGTDEIGTGEIGTGEIGKERRRDDAYQVSPS